MRLFVFLLGISFLSPAYSNHLDRCEDSSNKIGVTKEQCEAREQSIYEHQLERGYIGVKAEVRGRFTH